MNFNNRKALKKLKANNSKALKKLKARRAAFLNSWFNFSSLLWY